MKELTTRQAVILLTITQISTKIHRMPAVLSQEFANNGWIYLMLSLIPDLLILLIVLRISVLTKGRTIYQVLSMKVGKPIAIIYSLIIGLFFLYKITTPFKGIHEFFVSAVFDNLEWKYFSVIFLLLISFMAANGLYRIGRTGEVLSFFILIGFIGVLALAVPTARFSNILPTEIISFKQYSMGGKTLTAWLADFITVLYFVGRVKENKFKLSISISFIISSLAIIFFCITFYSIYDNLSTYPNVAISAITEFSLLSSNLGRIDWILVLFVMAGSVLTTGLYAQFSCESFHEATKFSKKSVAVFLVAFLYIIDNYIFTDSEKFLNFAFIYASWFVLFVNYVLPLMLWIILELVKNKNPKYAYYPYQIRKKSYSELKLKQWNSLTPKQTNKRRLIK